MRRRGSGAMRCFASIVIALYVHLSIATFFPGAFHSAAESNRLNRWHNWLGLGFQELQLKISNSRNFQRQIVTDGYSFIIIKKMLFMHYASYHILSQPDKSPFLRSPLWTDGAGWMQVGFCSRLKTAQRSVAETQQHLSEHWKRLQKGHVSNWEIRQNPSKKVILRRFLSAFFLNLQWGVPEQRMSPVNAAVVLSDRENDAVRVKYRIQTNTSNAISFCFSQLFSHWKPTWDHIDLSAHLTLLKCWHGQSLETSCSQESIWPAMKMYQSRNMPALICRQVNSGDVGSCFLSNRMRFCWRFYLFVATFDEVVISRHWHPPCTSCWRRSISIWSCPGSVKPVDSARRLSNSCPSRMYGTGGDHPTWEPNLNC